MTAWKSSESGLLVPQEDGDLDATPLGSGLYQGSMPPKGDALWVAGFDVVVLCAWEFQPPTTEFAGIDVHHAPFNDPVDSGPPTKKDMAVAAQAARFVVTQLKDGRRVLTTCYAGRNRSGMVNAIALKLHTGEPMEEILRRIREVRYRSLLPAHPFSSLLMKF